ncbi:MAG: hypothetical protein ACFE7R_08920 [Candidatus Hodarchaeota archaeon]
MNSIVGKITGTLILGIGWLVFIILFLAFYPTNFSFWQNLAIFLASGLIVAAIIIVVWTRHLFSP